MKHWRRGIGALCLGLSLVVSAPASAAVPRWTWAWRKSQSICDGKATYKYVVSWKARGGSREYQVNSGNKCQLAGRICGISSKTCYTQCSASGDCRAEVGACQVGRGAPWIQAYATDGSGYQRITALAPSRCQ